MELIMDRIEHVVLHGDFRVVATAEKVQPRGQDEPRCKVLVSLWQLGKDAVSSTPEMIRLEDPRATSLGEALSTGVALAMRRISERTQ
jgi:hypothetical protein